MENYTFRTFPGWLRKSNRYIILSEDLEDRNQEVPLSYDLPETEEICFNSWELDFIKIFNASNEWGLFEYPMSIFLFSLIKRNSVIEILEDINNSYSKLFLNDLLEYLSLLKYKNDIYNYSLITYGQDFVNDNLILLELKNTPIYEVEYNHNKKEIETYVINNKTKTYEKIFVTIIEITSQIFRDGVLEKTIFIDDELHGIIYKDQLILRTSYNTFYKYPIEIYSNIYLSKDNMHINLGFPDLYPNIYFSKDNININLGFPDLKVLEKIWHDPKKYDFDNDWLDIEPFRVYPDYLGLEFCLDGNSNRWVNNTLDINEFNRKKFIKELKKFYCSDVISRVELFPDEVILPRLVPGRDYNNYRLEKFMRNIIEIPFTIQY